MALLRPCWTAGITWLLVCLIGAWFSLEIQLILLVVFLLCLVLFLCISFLRQFRLAIFITVVSALALASLLAAEFFWYRPLEQRVDTIVNITAVIENRDDSLVMKVTDGDLPSGTRLMYFGSDAELSLEPYDCLSGPFVLRSFDEYGLSKLWRKAGGVWFGATPEDYTGACLKVTAGEAPWTAWFTQVRRNAVSFIQTHLSGDIGAVVAGICFGADQELTQEANNDFRICGVSHLFAVSGFHMVLISQGLLWLLKVLWIPRKLRALITMAFTVAFMAVVGFSASIIRAGVMCLLMLFADCVDREPDSLNSMGLALLVLLMPSPFAAYDAGLILSFAATFGILYLHPRLYEFLMRHCLVFKPNNGRLKTYTTALQKGILSTASVTISATVLTLPATIFFFKNFSTVGVIANLLATLPSSVLMVTGCLACIVAPLGLSFITQPLLFIAGCLAKYLLRITEWISGFPLATVTVTDTYVFVWLIGSVVLLALGWVLLRKRGLCLTAGLCTIVLCVGILIRSVAMYNVTRIQPITNSKGDLAVSLQYNHHVALILSPTDADTLFSVRAHLRQIGIANVDAVFLVGGEDVVISYIPLLLDDYFEKTILLCDTIPEQVNDSFAGIYSLKGSRSILWENITAEFQQEFLRVTVGKTNILFCCGAHDAAMTPAAFRENDAIVYSASLPMHMTQLYAPIGIVQGSPKEFPRTPTAGICGTDVLYLAHEGSLPILSTRGEGDVSVTQRGGN